MQGNGRARAHTNIALIKYWGKRDETLFLPMNSSLSLTLDAFYTDTKVIFSDSFTADHFVLNGHEQPPEETVKISRFLDLFRKEEGISTKACVESYNHVPTAAGLASSASGFAALALATHESLGLDKTMEELSTYARRGSGSSSRSLFGGFVEWDKGTNALDSYAHFIDSADWDVGMVILVLDAGSKKTPSRVGMLHTVATSPFYKTWVETAADDLEVMREAIFQKDLETVGKIAEHNAMKMHATTLSSNPSFTYWSDKTILAQEVVREIRDRTGLLAYMTMDAGPNVKVLCRQSEMIELARLLELALPFAHIITSQVGPGASVLSEEEWQTALLEVEKPCK